MEFWEYCLETFVLMLGILLILAEFAVMICLGLGPILLAIFFSPWWLTLYIVTIPIIGGIFGSGFTDMFDIEW